MGGVVSGIFGDGGYGNLSDVFDKINQQLHQGSDQQQQQLKPYIDAGTGGLSGLQDWLAGMKDPSEAINNALSGYQQSDYSKNLLNSTLDQLKSAQATSGALGSGGGNMDIAGAANKINSADVNDYLNRYFGISDKYGQGQQGLAGMGLNATGQSNDALQRMLEAMAQAQTGGAQAGIAGQAYDDNWLKSIASLFGGQGGSGSGSGGLFSGISHLFGG